MKNTNKSRPAALRRSLSRVTRVHYLLIALLAGQILLYDAWQLITPETTLRRWIAVGALFAAVTVVQYALSSKKYSNIQTHRLAWGLIAADILFASYYVYLQRGMASRAVVLFAVPIIVSVVFFSRRALVAAASLSAAAYAATAIAYFTLHFSEGYKIELYGEVSFYCGVMLLLAALLWAVLRAKKRL